MFESNVTTPPILSKNVSLRKVEVYGLTLFSFEHQAK